MCGPGERGGRWARGLTGRRMTGWRAPTEVAQGGRGARALVMPSRWRETFGLAALEAAMSGIPVIASRATLICEDLERLGIGIGCEADDLDALAQAMTGLAHDDLAAARMSYRGVEHARSLAPTPGAWGEALVAIYKRKLSASQTLPCAPHATTGSEPHPAVPNSGNA